MNWLWSLVPKAFCANRPALLAVCATLASTGLHCSQVIAQSAPYVSATQTPPAWGQYSVLLTTKLQEALLSSTPETKRFREWGALSQKKHDGEAPDGVVVKVWINPLGEVTRAVFPRFANAAANDDFQAILTKTNVLIAPPADMLQPVNIRIALNYIFMPAVPTQGGQPQR